MLNVHGLSIAFQGTYLFENISFKIVPGNRIGLIGKNGAGKSTLLKLLSKEMEADSGQMAADKTLKIGFLKQDIDFEYGSTVLEESYKAFSEIKANLQVFKDNLEIIQTGNNKTPPIFKIIS